MATIRKFMKYSDNVTKVLCVNLESSMAGAEQSLLLLVRFVPKNIQIFTACSPGILADRLGSLGIRTYRILASPKRFNYFWVWFFYIVIVNLQIFVIAFRTKPYIIHANGTKALLAAVLARIFTGSKILWHMRDWKCSRLLAEICEHISSKIVTVSRSVKNNLVNVGIKAEHIDVVYNGTDSGDIVTEVKERNENNPIVFANIGQFVPWKKQFLFIEAAEKFLQEGLEGKFIMIGDDIFCRDSKYKKKLIDRVETSHFAKHIKILGWRDRLNSFWPKINCLVHTTDVEPFGRVIIEAMAHGIPIIAVAAGGPSEIIISGKTGLLFNIEGSEELFNAMKIIAEDRGLAHKLAINAKQYVLSTFEARKTAEDIARVYEGLIAT